jgi:hypothetical protein
MVYLCKIHFLGTTAADGLIITILKNLESDRFDNDGAYQRRRRLMTKENAED